MAVSPLRLALEKQHVKVELINADHYRVRGGMAIDTDYIIRVICTANESDCYFKDFLLSKTYSTFRLWAQQMSQTVNTYRKEFGSNNTDCKQLMKYSDLITHMIESQRTQYLGKVNYLYVKMLAKQRGKIIKDVLDATCKYFPSVDKITSDTSRVFCLQMATLMETFFLTDHCDSESSSHNHYYTGVTSVVTNLITSTRGLLDGSTHKRSSSKDSKESKNVDHSVSTSTSPNSGSWLPLMDKFSIVTGGSAHNNNNSHHQQQDGKKDESARSPRPPTPTSIVVPLSRKNRDLDHAMCDEDDHNSNSAFDFDEHKIEKDKANYMLNETPASPPMVPNYSQPQSLTQTNSGSNSMLETNTFVFAAIAAIVIAGLKYVKLSQITIDADIALLLLFAAYCLGLHTPRPLLTRFSAPMPMIKGKIVSSSQLFDNASNMKDPTGRALLRRSMEGSTRVVSNSQTTNMTTPVATIQEDANDTTVQKEEDGHEAMANASPMPKFPNGAKIGSHKHCWSEPDPANFSVRGPNYLKDKKKVASGEYVFTTRGVDLFLTDTCPEDVGRIPCVFGGRLREKPTFIVNFRLPWGVLVFYYEIPELFVPFLQAQYEHDGTKELPSMDNMTPAERTVCRFLMGDSAHKNKTLKIVPYVVDGPWVVKHVVGGKPALIGNKLPIHYTYSPSTADGKCMYLEADLDIAASSAARSILSVARSYTQVLTIDLGFVVQANEVDELPEQMLVGCRLHGIDPMRAPCLPPLEEPLLISGSKDEDSNSMVSED